MNEGIQCGINRAEFLHNFSAQERLTVVNEGYKAFCEAYVNNPEEYIHEVHDKPCIFISHKSEDKHYAKGIGDQLNSVGFDTYLDMYDDGLQGATDRNDQPEIVKHIQLAIGCATHILVLITEHTNSSWWVPYEVGYAKKSGCVISFFAIGGGIFVPEYLNIEGGIQIKDGYFTRQALYLKVEDYVTCIMSNSRFPS